MKIILCGVARDCADRLPYSLKILEKIGAMFEECTFILHENDSIDGTRSVLTEFVRKHANVDFSFRVQSETKEQWTNYQNGKPYRPEQIARARNIVLEKAMSHAYDRFTHVAWMDLDFVLEPDYDGIAELFTREDWDGVFANGVAPNGCYWDWFALRDRSYPQGVETLGDAWYALKRPHHFIGEEWWPVKSAFGGFAVYKRESLRGSMYSSVVRHTHAMHQGVGPLSSRCEHVGLHEMMASDGHGRFFINPRMIFRYSGKI